jgi:phosphoribosylaminoimidazole-succinocarboxamide synthase
MFNLKSNKKILQEEIGEKIYLDTTGNACIVEFRDVIKLNNRRTKLYEIGNKIAGINAFFMDYLNAYNIPTAYIKIFENKIYLYNHNKFLFNIKIINKVNSRLARLFNKKDDECLSIPIFEFQAGYSEDNLVNESHLISFDLCTNEELKFIKRMCSKVNAVLKSFFERRNCNLEEYTCSFGKDGDKIMLLNSFDPVYFKVSANNTKPFSTGKPGEFKNYIEFLVNLITQR